jgi:phage baseplate assembly protein W
MAIAINTRTYKDIDLDFFPNPITKDILKKTNEGAIAASISNLLQTSNYERLFNPDLGCNLKRYLFEPIDDITTNNIREEITRTLANFEPRIDLLDVQVEPFPDQNLYNVAIKFFIKNDPDPITITLFLERVR